jgi:hypothetical protein
MLLPPPRSAMNSRRRMSAPKLRRRLLTAQTSILIGAGTDIKNIAACIANVAVGSCVDGCAGRPAKGRRWKSVTVKE